jgi:hypothetical protein
MTDTRSAAALRVSGGPVLLRTIFEQPDAASVRAQHAHVVTALEPSSRLLPRTWPSRTTNGPMPAGTWDSKYLPPALKPATLTPIRRDRRMLLVQILRLVRLPLK